MLAFWLQEPCFLLQGVAVESFRGWSPLLTYYEQKKRIILELRQPSIHPTGLALLCTLNTIHPMQGPCTKPHLNPGEGE